MELKAYTGAAAELYTEIAAAVSRGLSVRDRQASGKINIGTSPWPESKITLVFISDADTLGYWEADPIWQATEVAERVSAVKVKEVTYCVTLHAEFWQHTHRWASEQAKFRALQLPVLSLLGIEVAKVLPCAHLAPAALLLDDLQQKLKHAFAKGRPACFQHTAQAVPGLYIVLPCNIKYI